MKKIFTITVLMVLSILSLNSLANKLNGLNVVVAQADAGDVCNTNGDRL